MSHHIARSPMEFKVNLSRGYSLKNACHLNLLAAATTATGKTGKNQQRTTVAFGEMHFSFNFQFGV